MSQRKYRRFVAFALLASAWTQGCNSNSENGSSNDNPSEAASPSANSPSQSTTDSPSSLVDGLATPGQLSLEQQVARDTLLIAELESKAQFAQALETWDNILARLTQAHGADAWQVRTAEVSRSMTEQRSRFTIAQRNDMVSIADRERRGDRFASLGQSFDALSMYTEGLSIAAGTWGDASNVTLTLRNKVATQQELTGDYNNALTSYLAVISGREMLFGSDHPITLESVGNLARFHEHVGRYDLAVQQGMKRVEGYRRTFGDPSVEVAEALNDLGASYLAASDWQRAERELSAALAMRRELLSSSSPEVAHSLRNLALAYMAQQRFEAAEPLLSEAIAILERLGETESIAELQLKRGSCFLAVENLAAAEVDYAAARFALNNVQDLVPILYADACFKHGYILGRLGRYEEARPLLESALAVQQVHLAATDPTLQQTQQILTLVRSKLDGTRVGADPTTLR